MGYSRAPSLVDINLGSLGGNNDFECHCLYTVIPTEKGIQEAWSSNQSCMTRPRTQPPAYHPVLDGVGSPRILRHMPRVQSSP